MKTLLSLLSSLKLAVVLLVMLLLGLSVGTILETRLGAEVAGQLVYYSLWFLALQGLFAINLAMSLASLFPWTRKRVGYVLIHASLILVFVGAAITFFFKVEGNLSLWEGESGSVIEQHDSQGRPLASHRLPFTVRLDDFVLDTYPGTMRPAGYASRVTVTDSDTGRTFAARIWMNHELHHRGYALFQASFQQDGGREATVLAVSKDPGQNIVFAGYLLLIAGMLVVLAQRMRQGAAGAALLAFFLLAGGAARATDGTEILRRLPVQHDGRTMPLDTLARESVWSVTGSHAWQAQDPVATFSGWVFDPRAAAAAPVVKLGSRDLAAAMGLPPSTTHASFLDIIRNPGLSPIIEAAHQASAEGRPLRGVHSDAEKLEKRIVTLKTILVHDELRPIPDPANPRARWSLPPSFTPEGLTMLMSGPRPAGWPSAEAIEREIFYNRLDPVRLSWIILLGSLVLSIAAWARKSPVLDRIAAAALVAGFGMMTWGIVLRWQVGERIPAANMYESLLFLAWGVGLFAVVAYAVLRNRLVVLNAAFMAALTMALADLLPIDRFIHPIAPVLAGTPWLAIHVPIIMLGYAILALGMVVAHMQVGATLFAPRNTELQDRMYDLLYGYIFAGSIFLIAGIITGSMWAASSWGRYWGWDPKEVWSLVAFLAYMAILHAKLDRMVGKFGVAVASILAFQTIVMTYLGVNFVLSTGMHSYGMGDSPIVFWMVLVGVLEILFLAWGILAYRKTLPTTAETPRRRKRTR